MKRFICTVLCLVLACTALVGCQGANQNESQSQDAGEMRTASEAAADLMKIDTKYCVLKYPSKWGDDFSSKINEDKEYTVSFLYDGNTVFDIILNGSGGSPLGAFESGDEKVTVRVKTAELDSKDKNIQIYKEMQDDINVIIDNLKMDYKFTAGDFDPDDNELFEIKTSKVSLYYPKKWQDEVKTEVDGDKVSFSCNETKLFDLVFGECEGDILGTYDGTKLYLIDYPLDKGKLKADEIKKMTAMKEDINVIIDNLSKSERFSTDR